ncbi:hypothetical protein Nepgr_015266 [Nepenthes gracilis]|uniref:Kinesin motor domain-containing protein n=1 Tax=Nepenthes gracilis TaxID=150966 RepID=A0AAD3XRC3_NEPGR|nr:hypothetical protein Nepgr_015266 [Nepenthes gracilis]
MLRDFKFLHRNSRKDQIDEEIENVPVTHNDPSSNPANYLASRRPLHAIPEPTQNSELDAEQEASTKSMVERTPAKPKGKGFETSLPLRTPEKQGNGALGRNRFGWSSMNESRNEGKSDTASYLSQSSQNGCSSNLTPRMNRITMGRTNSGYSECTSTQSTPSKSVSKPPNPGFAAPLSCSRYLGNGSARVGSYSTLSRGLPVSSGPTMGVNTVDVPHFDLKENPSFWMDHNLQVIIRVRPLNKLERSTHGYNRCIRQDSAQSITWIGQPETRFTFDHVACESVDQEMLFRMAGLPMVENCLSGYNSCMFTYGQTGSGKTYTMLGEIEDLDFKPSPNRGMIPRIFEFLFARIKAEEESRSDEKLKYSCKCSFLEIYNEQTADLLDPSSTNLLLREDVRKGVYVENLSEFEVHSVADILKLLAQGSSNRKVAATNMNRESSRSHSVFTCVIESKWERDSTTNLRFARLNLVDLAGSERQKTSGAEGERLKEAANINKSLSTLGHVIMVLVDVAHGKPRHVPYRDSRLTFLLQDSLGGNSKTMIIANISPSICCAAETLNTLKFAQRAKLVQNNAVVNEDSSGNVTALQNQIQLLKEELFALKRQNAFRCLSFGPSLVEHTTGEHEAVVGTENKTERENLGSDDLLGSESKGNLRVTSKQLKSLETMLASALRREQMAETSIKQLEAENEQLNHLVHQREEDTRSAKMMLKFREDKIHRMESLLGSLKPVDAYLLEENIALSEEIQLLRAKVDRNPEVTRFALENIRLLDQLRKFQDFYEEGERGILLEEVSELRDQLIQFLDGNKKQQHHVKNQVSPQAINTSKENDTLRSELNNALNELTECRINLESCLECNAKLSREIDDLHAMLHNMKPVGNALDDNVEEIKSTLVPDQEFGVSEKEKQDYGHQNTMKHAVEVVNLELELDVLKIILKEERLSHNKMKEKTSCLTKDLKLAEESALLISKQYDAVKEELREAKSIIEALESQQLLSINEMEDLRCDKNRYLELLHKQELEISEFKEKICNQESINHLTFKNSGCEESPLQAKLTRMQASLDMARKLNTWYQSDHAGQMSNQEEMDEVCRQAEAETAEVIVCLQEELSALQQHVQDSELKEEVTGNRLLLLETELRELHDTLHAVNQDNKALREELCKKERDLKSLSYDWELVSSEIKEALLNGHNELMEASNQLDSISSSLPIERRQTSEQVCRIIRQVSEKDSLIIELNRCLEDAHSKRNDMECMLRSLKGAALVITESHQQECNEKEREITRLRSELNTKTLTVTELEKKVKLSHDKIKRTSTCAIVAFLIVNRLSDVNSNHLEALRDIEFQLRETMEMNQMKDISLSNQVVAIEDAEKHIRFLTEKLEASEDSCSRLRQQLVEQHNYISSMQRRFEEIDEYDILKTKEKLTELKAGISIVKSCVYEYKDQATSEGKTYDSIISEPAHTISEESISLQTGNEANLEANMADCHFIAHLKSDTWENISREVKNISECAGDWKTSQSMKSYKDGTGNDVTIVLLRKEIESSIESLKGVQAEITFLHAEKEKIQVSEKHGRESMESVKTQLFALQAAFIDFEKQCGLKMLNLNHKLQKVEESAQEAGICLCQTKELFESELDDAKIFMAQKVAEASCLLSKFEEAQDTMKEADVMINGLMIANEKIKFEMEGQKRKVAMLTTERDKLINANQILLSSNELKDQQYEELEKHFDLHLMETAHLLQEYKGLVSQMQLASEGTFMSVAHDVHCIKFQFQEHMKLMLSWLEEIWSEIILKDCAVSVLHFCHMGILLEAVNGFNTENSLLHHGICESNSIISDLREHNMKSREELKMCRMLKGKLLADIKKGFDCISRKEDETGELSLKLSTFKEKILDLQLQEEVMLERSNYMGSELAILMKELDQSNSNILASYLEQEKLLKDNEEVLEVLTKCFIIDLSAKDFELLVLASELQQLADEKADMENKQIAGCKLWDYLKKEIVTLAIFTDLQEQFFLDKEAEVTKEVEEVKMLLSRLSITEQENESLRNELDKLKRENGMLLNDLHTKESEVKPLKGCIDMLNLENFELQEKIRNLESSVALLQEDLASRKADLNDLLCSQSSSTEELGKKIQELQSCAMKNNALQEENVFIKNELRSLEECKFEAFRVSISSFKECVSLMEVAGVQCHGMITLLDEKITTLTDRMLRDTCHNMATLAKFMEELESLDCIAENIVSGNLFLQTELLRKDEVLAGLLFDLSLLQESAVNTRDQKADIEALMSSLRSTEDELAMRSRELDEAISHGQTLEVELKRKMDTLYSQEMNLSKSSESLKMLTNENMELSFRIEEILAEKSSVEKELIEKRKVADSLEMELCEIGKNLDQLYDLNESHKSNLNEVIHEKDQLQNQLLIMEEKLETALALAEQNEAMAAEAQQIAESRRIYMEEKEEEVKLLETSVQELDCTINVLENKVDILKGEAERQRLQREELESELHSLKHQMQNVKNADADVKRLLDEKEKNLQGALMCIQNQEKDLAHKDKEIAQCKAHICELNLHAEAQACEYKKKFKALEAMAEQVKPEGLSSHGRTSSSSKLEKNATKARGSGSPFKCIGLGLVQQLKSEKDEDLTAERLHIEELEALAASRQKEIFTLNARLAAAESMTHDVIRDLLGVKLDMSSYVSLLNNQRVEKITEKSQLDTAESQAEDKEIAKLKKQLNEFIEERKSWLEEIDRRQAQLIAAQIALEKLRHSDRLLTAENDMLKMEIAKHKKNATELEGEVKKLTVQQNLQQRIHHHAKIKEENNVLKIQNEKLSARLRRAETILACVRGELAQHRACSGSSYTNVDEEQLLKETEEERPQLGQKLLGLCTSILKAAGITKPMSEINLSAAEEALEKLTTQVSSLERELEDLKSKNKIASERIGLSDLIPQSSPLSPRMEDNYQTPIRVSQSPFFSALDR